MKSDFRMFIENETNLGEKFVELSDEFDSIILYGCGVSVIGYIRWLKKRGINKPIYLVDKNRSDEIDNRHIYNSVNELEEVIDIKKAAVIVSSPKYRKEITQELKRIVPSENIYSFEVELNLNLGFEVEDYRKFVIKHFNDFCALKGLFADSLSYETLKNVVKGRITGNLDYYEEVAVFPQYFGNDFLNKNVYYRFVDCGAYIGDTFKEWDHFINANGIPISEVKYFGLEPDANTFRSLKKAVEGKEIYTSIFDVGAWNESGVLRFQTAARGESKGVENEGEEEISVVELDDLLGGERISMIKMDIEGSEMQAIEGATGIIKEQKPCLAICIYHKYSDIFDVIKKIHSISPDYKLYLRHHNYSGPDTILYAVI